MHEQRHWTADVRKELARRSGMVLIGTWPGLASCGGEELQVTRRR